MLNFKCPNCDGELSVNRSGDLLCSYCDSKFNFSDKELKEYREFRYNMLYYLSCVANRTVAGEDTERLWQHSSSISLSAENGSEINISYIYKSERSGVECYTARNNVIFVFEGDRAERFAQGVKLLCYPSADVRDLAQYFPVITGRYALKNGKTMLAVSKPETVFPLGAFGSLDPAHAAWIVSRLENLCCVMEYSGVIHGGIALDELFINAGTHELYLIGGWENAVKGSGSTDLAMMRRTIKRLMGSEIKNAPKEFIDFLNKTPLPDAYKDFEDWDTVIEKGFGGRRFHKLDLTDIKI